MKLLRRLDYWMHSRRRDAELAEELDFHRALSSEPIGNTTLAREDARAVYIWPWLESVAQDLRYAIRNLRRQPGFTLIALLTLGLAIGLNTSFFTVFDAVALRLWSVRDPARVVKIASQPQRSRQPHGLAVAEVRYFAEQAKSLSAITVMSARPVHLGFEDFGKHTTAIFVTGNYFQGLGIGMQLGRGFLPEEDLLDAPVNAVVLSYTVWRDHYGSDPAIAGKTIRVDDLPFTVVGVAAEEFMGTRIFGFRSPPSNRFACKETHATFCATPTTAVRPWPAGSHPATLAARPKRN
jgi:macrolide transport system ATP-binding/permease protein